MPETIQELNAGIARLDTTIAGLVLQKQALKKRRNNLILINRCPDEILIEIFLNMHASEMAEQFRDYPHALTTLPRVCARWWAIAASSPRIWSLIDLAYGPPAVRRMLALSAKHNLVLWAQMGAYVGAAVDANLATIAHSAHGARVRVLDIDVEHCGRPRVVDRIIDELVPALTNLRELHFIRKKHFDN